MGRHFPLISDTLVKPLAAELQAERCDGCKEENPQYILFGPAWYIALALRGKLVPSTIEKHGMQRACLKCTRASFSRVSFARWREGLTSLRSPGRFDMLWPIRRLFLAAELARTPPYAFFAQDPDWPVCCRRCCEYRGYPGDAVRLREVVGTHEYWQGCRHQQQPFEKDSWPEDPTVDVNLFGCQNCGVAYFTYQFS